MGNSRPVLHPLSPDGRENLRLRARQGVAARRCNKRSPEMSGEDPVEIDDLDLEIRTPRPDPHAGGGLQRVSSAEPDTFAPTPPSPACVSADSSDEDATILVTGAFIPVRSQQHGEPHPHTVHVSIRAALLPSALL